MVNQELVKAAEAAGGDLVSWSDVQWESDGCEDIAPSFPLIKVVQRMSTMEGASKHNGEFWHSDREGAEAFEATLGVVPLVKRDTRAFFEEGAEKPLCMSADGVVPMANQPLWSREEAPLPAQPMACMYCPLSAWDDVTGKPPACRESKVLLVVRDDDSLAQMRLSGMSIKPFERYVSKALKPKKLPMYSKRFIFTTQELRKEGKTWNEIEVYGEALSIAEAQSYQAVLREQRQKFESTLTESGGTEWIDGDGTVADDGFGGRGAPFE